MTENTAQELKASEELLVFTDNAASKVKGLIEEELNLKDAAKESYQKSLTIQPDFILPKNKIEALSQ